MFHPQVKSSLDAFSLSILTQMTKPSSIDRYLTPAERLIQISRKHPIVVAGPFFVWALVVAAAATAGAMISPASGNALDDLIAGGIALVFTVYLGFAVWKWRAAKYVLTNQRILFIEGILSIKVTAISLAKVTDTTFSRPLLGRILGYGSLMLDSSGENPGLSIMDHLPGADEFYRRISSLLVERTSGFVEAPHPGNDDTHELPVVRR